MTTKILDMAILAIQQQSLVEGARLLRIALKGEMGTPLSPEMRAVAYLWLAETTPDGAEKRRFLGAAVQADAHNVDARQRLAALLSPTATATGTLPVVAPQVAPYRAPATTGYATPVNIADYVAQIIGGPKGPGTAVFIADFIVATTRATVGALDRVTVGVHPSRQIAGTVVRAFIDLDLAFVRVDQRLAAQLPITPLPRLPEDAKLYALTFDGETLQTRQRATKRILAPHWIPTDLTELPDTGGEPLFDERGHLAGIMTRNSSRATTHLHGLHIAAIRRALEMYLREAAERRVYCSACGVGSRAFAAGLYHCEVCGALAPSLPDVARTPQPAAASYEAVGARCVHCGATVGLYQDRCLRCGQEQRGEVARQEKK